jgi:hypothetical protein
MQCGQEWTAECSEPAWKNASLRPAVKKLEGVRIRIVPKNEIDERKGGVLPHPCWSFTGEHEFTGSETLLGVRAESEGSGEVDKFGSYACTKFGQPTRKPAPHNVSFVRSQVIQIAC